MNSVNTQCDAEKTVHHLKLLSKSMQSNGGGGGPFKFQVFCRVHWALLEHILYLFDALCCVYLVQVISQFHIRCINKYNVQLSLSTDMNCE
jgi:hypothetical protein